MSRRPVRRRFRWQSRRCATGTTWELREISARTTGGTRPAQAAIAPVTPGNLSRTSPAAACRSGAHPEPHTAASRARGAPAWRCSGAGLPQFPCGCRALGPVKSPCLHRGRAEECAPCPAAAAGLEARRIRRGALSPGVGAVAAHEILLAGQGPGLVQPGPALDLAGGGFPGAPLLVGYLLAIAPEAGSRAERSPDQHLCRCMRVTRHDVPPAALLPAAHVIDPFATSAA